MKKMKSILLTSLMAVVLCFCFLLTGCSAAGTYEFKYIEMEALGETVKYEVGDTYMGETLEADDYEAFTLNKDGTIAGEDNEGLTWVEEDGNVIIKYEDEEVAKYKKDGNKLIMERSMGGLTMKIVYKK